jgi:uncharacterized protein (TIGR02611 family)
MLTQPLRQGRRIVVAVFGFTVVLLGVAMIVTPFPGWLVILLGLSILSAEFVWARRLMNRLKLAGKEITEAVFGSEKVASQAGRKR